MKKYILLILLLNSVDALADISLTPLGTNIDAFKATAICETISRTKEQCESKNPKWYIKPISQHIIYNYNIPTLEALMFKKDQYANVLKELKSKFGNGIMDITKTATSWTLIGTTTLTTQEEWSYTLSQNPNGDIALIGFKK